MKNYKPYLLALGFAVLMGAGKTRADNPLIMDQFTADPTARFFEGKIYLYPSHDMKAAAGGRGGAGWFSMEDYHVFSSENLMDWTDHGVILNQKDVPWVRGNANSMWAPDCVTKDGKYYFFFPASSRIGVAIADKPDGPYKVEPQPLIGGIDPCCFIDPKDGKAYLIWAQNNAVSIRKLKDDMKEFDPDVQALRVPGTPSDGGNVEGPFMFERKGVYYLTYPHAVRINGHQAEELEYSMGDGPLGPFKPMGNIMDQTPDGCWTNHHSIVQYKDQWYLFYHDKQLSPSFDKNRSVRADYLYFQEDGKIQKVIPTLRGVGVKDAKQPIQIDRYSAVSKTGTAEEFIDGTQTSLGWLITLSEKGAWTQYNRVDFGTGGLKSVKARSRSAAGGVIQIRFDNPQSPVVSEIAVGKSDDPRETSSKVSEPTSGVHNLVVTLKDEGNVSLDWVTFE